MKRAAFFTALFLSGCAGANRETLPPRDPVLVQEDEKKSEEIRRFGQVLIDQSKRNRASAERITEENAPPPQS